MQLTLFDKHGLLDKKPECCRTGHWFRSPYNSVINSSSPPYLAWSKDRNCSSSTILEGGYFE